MNNLNEKFKKAKELLKKNGQEHLLLYYDKLDDAKKEELSMRKWTKETAQAYIKNAKEKGLTYWSAVDYLKHHKTMHSII